MTTFAATGQAPGLVEIAQLRRLVSVALLGAQLKNLAGTGLNNRDGNDSAALVKYLRHPDLAAE
jgi:hypothetical protein